VGARKGKEIVVPRIGTESGWRLHVGAQCRKALKKGNVSLHLALANVTAKLWAREYSGEFSQKVGGYKEFKGAVHPGPHECPRGTFGGDQGGDEHARVQNHAVHLSPSTPV
jgi:hypothetical protein